MTDGNGPLRVAALTRGRDVPSARFRVRQFVAPLRSLGVHVDEHAPRRPAHRLIGRGRPGAFAHATLFRSAALAATHRADVTLLQRELVSTYHTLERLAKAPRVLDVDDAVHLGRKGQAADDIARIAESCRMVLAGNESLATWFRQWCDDVRLVPTAVDTTRYAPASPGEGEDGSDHPPILGWIGTAANAGNLTAIQAPVADVLADHPGARLRIVAERAPDLPLIPRDRWEFVPWSAEAEVGLLRSFTIGLMPLDDTPWNRGKCGFKLLQYLACGVPAVASPVGVNADFIRQGAGLGATGPNEWGTRLRSLLGDADLRRRSAAEGRAVVARTYSVDAVAPLLAGCLRDAAGRPSR